jgi:CRP-like cAMP-binding protein
MIGTSRETVTTLLNRMRDEGVIAIEDRHIIIRNLDRLHPHDG